MNKETHGMDELEKFVNEVKTEGSLEKIVAEPVKEPEAPIQEEDELEATNRKERRLRDRLQAERESNIAMAARLEALSEAQKFRQEAEPAEYTKSVERIYGTATPEAAEATELLKSAFKGVEERARQSAIEQIRQEQSQEQARVREEEGRLDSYVEELEDAHNVSFTPEMQKSYFSLLGKMSPKDDSGNIIAYADPEAVYEVFSEKFVKKPESRAKDLSSRSMVQGNASQEVNLSDDAAQRLLREAGII